MKSKYRKFSDGESVRVSIGGDTLALACCDCGCVHKLQLHRIDGETVDIAFFRDKRATAQLRRNNYGDAIAQAKAEGFVELVEWLYHFPCEHSKTATRINCYKCRKGLVAFALACRERRKR